MSNKFSKEISRMRRIEGQARGIAGMMEDERYCIDILNQFAAIEAALRAAKLKVLEIHADSCIEEALAADDSNDKREKFAELIALFGKTNR